MYRVVKSQVQCKSSLFKGSYTVLDSSLLTSTTSTTNWTNSFLSVTIVNNVDQIDVEINVFRYY